MNPWNYSSSGSSCSFVELVTDSCFEGLAGVRPLERLGGLVLGLDVREHLLRKVGLAGEDPVLEQPAPEDREEDLDLVEPRRVLGGELKAPPRMRV